MAKVYGVAGEWARVKGTVLGLWPLFLGIFASGIAVASMVFLSLGWGLIALAVILGYMVWCYRKGLRRIESFFKGARGEERVSGILAGLPENYCVFNDFLACGTHVDHVVVGPAGVFSIETKYWRGEVTIEDGHILLDGRLPDRPPLRQALREAALVKTELSKIGWNGLVTPVLAFASDTFKQHVVELQGAVVMNSCELRRCFETKRIVLAPAELARLIVLLETNR